MSKLVFMKKSQDWAKLKEEFEYQGRLLTQSNAILKRRLKELEDMLEEREREASEQEKEVERLREFIGERKDLEVEFQRGFKFLGRYGVRTKSKRGRSATRRTGSASRWTIDEKSGTWRRRSEVFGSRVIQKAGDWRSSEGRKPRLSLSRKN